LMSRRSIRIATRTLSFKRRKRCILQTNGSFGMGKNAH
jgi:hypothetical protein